MVVRVARFPSRPWMSYFRFPAIHYVPEYISRTCKIMNDSSPRTYTCTQGTQRWGVRSCAKNRIYTYMHGIDLLLHSRTTTNIKVSHIRALRNYPRWRHSCPTYTNAVVLVVRWTCIIAWWYHFPADLNFTSCFDWRQQRELYINGKREI